MILKKYTQHALIVQLYPKGMCLQENTYVHSIVSLSLGITSVITECYIMAAIVLCLYVFYLCLNGDVEKISLLSDMMPSTLDLKNCTQALPISM